MNNEEILEKVIEKAIKNGWKKVYLSTKDGGTTEWNIDDLQLEQVYFIIFSHDFAKAIFGEETKECVECNRLLDQPFTRDMVGSKYTEECRKEKHSYREIYDWQYHLQQLVLEEDPIKYLEKYI